MIFEIYTYLCAMAFVPCGSENKNEGIFSDCLELKIVSREELKPCDMVIAELQYSNKKRSWRPDGKNAAEMLSDQLVTNGYSYSFLNVKYSMPGENVFSPVICGMLKDCLSEKTNKTAADLMLLFMLSQNKIIFFEVLKTWFKENKLSVDFDDRADIIGKFLTQISKKSLLSNLKKTG